MDDRPPGPPRRGLRGIAALAMLVAASSPARPSPQLRRLPRPAQGRGGAQPPAWPSRSTPRRRLDTPEPRPARPRARPDRLRLPPVQGRRVSLDTTKLEEEGFDFRRIANLPVDAPRGDEAATQQLTRSGRGDTPADHTSAARSIAPTSSPRPSPPCGDRRGPRRRGPVQPARSGQGARGIAAGGSAPPPAPRGSPEVRDLGEARVAWRMTLRASSAPDASSQRTSRTSFAPPRCRAGPGRGHVGRRRPIRRRSTRRAPRHRKPPPQPRHRPDRAARRGRGPAAPLRLEDAALDASAGETN